MGFIADFLFGKEFSEDMEASADLEQGVTEQVIEYQRLANKYLNKRVFGEQSDLNINWMLILGVSMFGFVVYKKT